VADPTWDVRSILANRYSLEKIIGAGSMGAVWRAHDRQLNRFVACKILSESFHNDRTARERFQREARHVASLSHPNIVMVFDSGVADDRPFVVMELIEGPSLRQVLHDGPALTLPAAATIAVDLLAALAHAHSRGIIHRDIKPANLLVQQRDGAVKVADFGIAKSSEDTTELTVQGSFVGTAAYASPEQLARGHVGPSSDLYSAACVIYQCLTGAPPSGASDSETLPSQHESAPFALLTETDRRIPEVVSTTIARALDPDPERRPLDANEMLMALLPLSDRDSLRDHAEAVAATFVTDLSGEGPGSRDGSTPRVAVPTESKGGEPNRSLRTSAEPAPSRALTKPVTFTASAIAALAVVLLILGGAFTGGASGGSEQASIIPSGGFLEPGHAIRSPNGRYTLTMQSDGNLVDYRILGKVPIWQSGTSGNFNAYVVMQSDGDLVVYPPGRSAPAPGQPTSALWSSDTWRYPGSSASLLNNGRVVIRLPHVMEPLWTSPLRMPSAPNS
jgi:serine/threonine protein kinase